ncbi:MULTISPECIES: Bug family tripartite tricarboxylate transporter substrate binding protein [Ramlibacter]|uniref:Tripartite tricarboxylate transporter substrate binding protein n=1 Tax=Ramlibacter pinisoli TaxID=2682844 RepID=A0A6N8IY32_9BURK|nr:MULTISPECIES: tripartite tricarboxylate transporter substrate binding protein [Ramlibacter]MBA2961005.1 tripartite tricarboxylate transporter substrate binding protein [Ramlibacter sp. CGMCC 1.13660]MVQ30950.1 tripartite tricarboxylate transporter substrate binding protein [Ramlibacter pinisoli]
MDSTRRCLLVAGAALGSMPLRALAQEWPARAVKIVIPSAPGSSPDRFTRLIAERLSKQWNQAVVVENRPGASTRIGAGEVARAAPDGYTLLSTFGTHTMAKLLNPDTPYDPVTDFAAITQYAVPEVVMLVRSDSPYQTLKDLAAGYKSSGRPMRYGHFGNGSSFHFYGLVVGRIAGIEVVPVAYKGEALHLNDLLGGHLDVSFNSVGTALPHIRSGKLRALANVAPGRSKVLPDVPTFAELGYEGMERGGWFGFLAPAGTPAGLVDKVSKDIIAIVNDPAMARLMRDQGIEPVGSTPREFSRAIPVEVQQWQRLMTEFKVKGE